MVDETNFPSTIHESEFLLYTAPSGKVKVECFFHGETIWLPLTRIAVLFGVDKSGISRHLKNIYDSGELEREATVVKIATVQQEGKRKVSRDIEYYNLDAIISVGYRVNSSRATQFRIWATQRLKEFIIKGFVMDDERLKNGQNFGKDFFHELLERVRSIRASERRIYQQITDIFAECSIDYDPQSETTRRFYAHVQDKFHVAITGQTSAEIIHQRADASKPQMGLTTYKNAPNDRVLKSDVVIGKNYLNEKEIKRLERTVSSFFDYIENIIENRSSFTMESFADSVNRFLEFNEYRVLEGYGSVSRKQAEAKAYAEYEKFNRTQKIESDFDKQVKQLSGKKGR
ncbi:virulence RhuM family protein [Maridesulfovibrio sp.]|uniref:virulence RhuM family protein n=1 Tax=Maridesulfovibrio sp. TaxID=2795000 RepID=UPI0029C9D382|nr:virulence RhuM family protein [Maridesulfovibrio sp.]